jgi:hypothetical protein
MLQERWSTCLRTLALSFRTTRWLCPHYHNINKLRDIFSLIYKIYLYVSQATVNGSRTAQKAADWNNLLPDSYMLLNTIKSLYMVISFWPQSNWCLVLHIHVYDGVIWVNDLNWTELAEGRATLGGFCVLVLWPGVTIPQAILPLLATRSLL